MDEQIEMGEKEFNVEKLHAELCAAGFSICSVTSEGRIDWQEKPTESMLAQAESVKATHVPVTSQESLQLAYRRSGITTEEMVKALWQKLIENDPASSEALHARMLEIKSKLSVMSES